MNNSVQGPFAAVLTGVSHRYPAEPSNALEKVDLAIEANQSIVLIGRSGAGKSTLLSLLDGRLRGWSGAAVVLDHPMNSRHAPSRSQRADVGFVFQEFALVERASVRQNVLNGRLGRSDTLRTLIGKFSSDDYRIVESVMEDTGIAPLADKPVSNLSGGQRQRVSIARCLAQEPRLILADEPISNLDPGASETILKLLNDSARQREATLVFSSHQPQVAMTYADRVIVLDNGSIQFDGAPEDLSEQRLLKLYGTETSGDKRLRLVG